ncbi:MAG: Eco57I restriction-modification methylase domain-containing protein [Thermomicrobiales bacterium]
MVQLTLTSYRNQGLFSDHYLANVLPKDFTWQALADEARPVMAQIAACYDKYVPSSREGQIENDLIRPVLEILGHTFEVGPSLQMPGSAQTPDYVFYRDLEAKNKNKGKTLTDALPTQGGYAVGEAEHWDCPLDVPTTGASKKLLTNGNPSYQVATYIQHSGVDWGILTNGRHWRLYHRATAHKLDRFYDVDVPALLATNDPAAFVWFYGFFRRDAFHPKPGTGRGLEYILKESDEYAQNVSELLKGQVYGALRCVAQGFLDFPANHLSAADPATLKTIYDNALILLYRLLFIYYAEARGLLPLRRNDTYSDEYSLYHLARVGALALDKGTPILAGGARIWQSLRDLFAMINSGGPPFGVATFNGGLFDPAKHPFLETYTVGDARLRQAIDELARVTAPSKQTSKRDVNREFVDYRDLSERHLGTIYEGLLEYHLVPKKPEAQPTPARPVGAPDEWAVEIVNDKGERKVTGSYYTPDYIVKYIVEQTVTPVLDAAVADVTDYDARVNAVLAVTVLDPAMGSGHFLVEATEQIARYLLNLTPLEGTTGEPRDLAYWKRRVVQSCIFGVDLNPLAVELAKLSLWLVTVANDAPLSFLDHHLRVGNALVGAAISELGMMDDTAFPARLQGALAEVGAIEASEAADIGAVKEQERRYTVMRAALIERYGTAADAEAARYFGMDYPAGQREPFRDWLAGRNAEPQPMYTEWRDAVLATARERRFFHWELEFPEVFFAADGRPKGEHAGFDAVIGNPPYDVLADKERGESLADFKRFIDESENLQAAQGRKIDLFRLFVAKSLTLTRREGRIGVIVPMSILADQQTAGLRKHLLDLHAIQRIDAFPQKDDPSQRVFREAKLPTCIVIAQASPTERYPFLVTTHPGRLIEEVSGEYYCKVEDVYSLDGNAFSIPLLASGLCP